MTNEVRLLFAGDFAPCRRFQDIILEKGERVLGDALNFLNAADFSFVNLECPLTLSTLPINKDGPALKASPKCATPMRKFSVVGLANNHILDYGRTGLADTISACQDNQLAFVGAGLSLKEAQEISIHERKGIRIAIIALAEHEFNQSEQGGAGSAPINLIDNYHQIKEAKDSADIVIVSVHGGNEYFPYPRPGHRKMMRHFIDLGVDAVICHHPHVPGAYEIHNGRPIIYSLGNFVFDNPKPPKDWNSGYMAELVFDAGNKRLNSIELIPYCQSVQLGGIQLLGGEEKKRFLERIYGYRKKLESETEWLREWHAFVNRKADTYILKNFFPFTIRGLGFLARNTPIAKLLLNKHNALKKLNLLRCQSHRELLIASLESKAQHKND